MGSVPETGSKYSSPMLLSCLNQQTNIFMKKYTVSKIVTTIQADEISADSREEAREKAFEHDFHGTEEVLSTDYEVNGESESEYRETYFEMVAYIMEEVDKTRGIAHHRHGQQGRGGLYELAEELTDEFQLLYGDTEWGSDDTDETNYAEKLEQFLDLKEEEFADAHPIG